MELNSDIEEMKEQCEQDMKEGGLFIHVMIETISACNSNCSFCPVSTVNNRRPIAIMDDLLFQEIVKQLKDLNFRGSLCPQINNELLLDSKIFERIDYVKQVLQDNVTILVETNGLLLTVPKIYKFFDVGVDRICINDYADHLLDYLLFTKRILKILRELNVNKIKRDVTLEVNHRLKKQILSDRSGKVVGRKVGIAVNKKFCDWPLNQININPKGDLFICCRDSYYDGVIGKIREKSIKEIWYGEKYARIRNALLKNERILPICEKCSSNGSVTL